MYTQTQTYVKQNWVVSTAIIILKPIQLASICKYLGVLQQQKAWTGDSLRQESHYDENDGDGDVTFRLSHFMFHTEIVTMSLMWHGNGCYSDGNGDSQGDICKVRKQFSVYLANEKVSDSYRRKPYRFQTWPEDRGYIVFSNDAIIYDCVNWRVLRVAYKRKGANGRTSQTQ